MLFSDEMHKIQYSYTTELMRNIFTVLTLVKFKSNKLKIFVDCTFKHKTKFYL